MTIYTIHKGRHYARPVGLKLYTPSTVLLTQTVTFNSSCRYDLHFRYQLDINKLFGVGYFPTHHVNSVRFGWRYDLDKDMIEILAYCYINKERFWESMGWVEIGQPYIYEIERYADYHVLRLRDVRVQVPVPTQLLGYHLKPYFGGNCVAPHTMTIEMS